MDGGIPVGGALAVRPGKEKSGIRAEAGTGAGFVDCVAVGRPRPGKGIASSVMNGRSSSASALM